MPIHIDGAVAPAAACPANVSQRKAPGAMRAMAFIVKPVSPRVCFISPVVSAIAILLSFIFYFTKSVFFNLPCRVLRRLLDPALALAGLERGAARTLTPGVSWV